MGRLLLRYSNRNQAATLHARRRLCAATLCCVLFFLLLATGCAYIPGIDGEAQPDRQAEAIEPDLSPLEPAEQALRDAQAENANDFSPRALDAARRRLTLARDIIYNAARQGRQPNAQERERIQDLVDAARLDVRLARVRNQALAVASQVDKLRDKLDARGAADSEVRP